MEENYLTYDAVFEEAPEGGYNVSFPDIPGCYTCGDDFTEAFDNARDALTLMLVDMIERGIELPKKEDCVKSVKVKSYNLSKYKKKNNEKYSCYAEIVFDGKFYRSCLPDFHNTLCLSTTFDEAVHKMRKKFDHQILNYISFAGEFPNVSTLPELIKLGYKKDRLFEIKSNFVKNKFEERKCNKQVIIINGVAQSGKDSFVELFQKHYKAINFSSIDKVKEIAKTVGWFGSKTEKDRKFLSDMKKLLAEYNDLPYSTMQVKYNEFLSDESEFLFLHIREPEEIKRAKKEFNAKTLFIKNYSVKNIDSNDSDKNVENYHYDYTILNNGSLDDLEEKAIEFGRMLKSSKFSSMIIKDACDLTYICKPDGLYCNGTKVGDYVRY